MSDWKNDRAEKEMKDGTESIRLAAVERAKKQKENEMVELPGKYTITFSANKNMEDGEVKNMLEEIENFSKKCDEEHPNVSILIEPIED